MIASAVVAVGGEAPGAGGSGPYVDVRETHAAVVFLVGERAYKLKVRSRRSSSALSIT